MSRDSEGAILVEDRQFAAWAAPHLAVMRRAIASHVPAQCREDVLQESLTRAWRRWCTYSRSKGTPRSWLLAITFNEARRLLQHDKELYLLPGSESVDPSGTVHDVDEALDVRSAVRRLSVRQREAIVLYYYIDLPINEIAIVMGCSVGTVKSTLSDARRALSNILKEER